MKKGFLHIYIGLSCVAFICILIQVFLAGVAVFQNFSYWEAHKTFALFKYMYVVLFIVCLLGKLPKDLTWLAFILFAVVNLQYYTAHGFFGALHVVIPFLIFWLNVVMIRKSFNMIKYFKNEGEDDRP